jgi:hypothetical protein
MRPPLLLTDIGAKYADIVSEYVGEFSAGYADGYHAYIDDNRNDLWDVEKHSDNVEAVMAYAIGAAVGNANARAWVINGEVDENGLPLEDFDKETEDEY